MANYAYSPEERALNKIFEEIEKRFKVGRSELLGRRRDQALARVRAIAITLAYDLIRSAPQIWIAKAFKRQHAVVPHNIKLVRDTRDYMILYAEIKREIQDAEEFRHVR